MRIPVPPTISPRCRISRFAGAPFVIVVLSFPGPVMAETEVEIGFRLEHSDNVNLSEANEQSDTARVPYIDLGWSSDSPRLSARIDGNLQYVDYRDDTNSDDTAGEVSAVADIHLIENHLDYHIENRYQQIRTDELDPATPDNTEDVNTFVMGPELGFDPSPVDRISLGVRYGETTFERGNDTERWGYGAIWSHRLSVLNEFTVSAQRQDVEFTEFSGNPLDYTLDEVGVGGTHRLARGEVSLTVGQRWIEQANGNELDRGFARFDWNYTPTRRTEFDLRAETGLTDSGVRLLSRDADTIELPAGDAFNSEDILTLSEVQARLVRRGANLDVTLAGVVSEEDFATSDLDREIYGASLGVEYPLTPVDRLSWTVRGERTEYVLINRSDDDILTTISLRHLVGRNIFTEGGYRYWQRDSSDDGSSFEENRIFLAVGYRWGE